MPVNATNTPRVRRRFGKFRLERRLGQTDTTDTFEATDTVMGHGVVLKILRPEVCSRTALKRFAAAMPAITASDHPGVLRLQDASLVDGRLVLAMPPGLESLSDRLTRRVSADAALLLTGQLLDTMAYAHHRQLAHGQLHPRQIILFPDLAARIGDFGLAELQTDASDQGAFREDVAALSRIILALFGIPIDPDDHSLQPLLNDCPRLADRIPERMLAWLQRGVDRRRSRRYSTAAVMKAEFLSIQEQVRDELGCRSSMLNDASNPFPRVRTAA